MDHVSMSGQIALYARRVVQNVATIIGVELACGAQGAEFLDDGLSMGVGTHAAYETIRAAIPSLETDRPLRLDREAGQHLVLAGELQGIVEQALDEVAEGGTGELSGE